MSLRSFLISVSALILTAITAYAFVTERTLVEAPLKQIQASQIESVAEMATSILRAKQYLLSSFVENILKDKNLAKDLLLAPPVKLVEKIRTTTGCDVVEVHRLGDSELNRFLPAPLRQRIQSGKLLSRFEARASRTLLLEYAPIKLYDEVVAILVLGFSLNDSVTQEVSQASRNQVYFHLDAARTKTMRALPLAIELGDGNYQTVYLEIDRPQFEAVISHLKMRFALAGLAGLLLIAFLGYALISFGFLRPFKNAIEAFDNAAADLDRGNITTPAPRRYPLAELTKLFSTLSKLQNALKSFQLRIQQKTRVEAAGEKAAQVAHDINGPLTALEMAITTVLQDPSAVEQKNSIQQLMQRIRNTVSVVAESPAPGDLTVVNVGAITEEIIAEKRLQYLHSKIQIHYVSPPEDSSRPAIAEPRELMRVLSNILDNAFESIVNEGKISVSVTNQDSSMVISISDTGHGISQNILTQIGQRGFSFGKTQGSGLGIWHATEVLKKWGGDFSIRSQEARGTEVQLRLRVSPVLVEQFFFPAGSRLIILDDDVRIHDLWAKRLREINAARHGIEAHYFTRAETLLEWLVHQENDTEKQIFLFDYQLADPQWDGLKLLESLKIRERAFLITGHEKNLALYSRCGKQNVKLLPKNLLKNVPIKIEKKSSPLITPMVTLLLVSWLTFSSATSAKQLTTEIISQHDVELQSNLAPDTTQLNVAFLFHDAPTKIFSHSFLEALVMDKLRRLAVPSQKLNDDYAERFQNGNLSNAELLGAKLIVELTIEKSLTESNYFSSCLLTLLRYERYSNSGNRWMAKTRWSKTLTTRGVSKEDLEDHIGQFIQKELNGLPKNIGFSTRVPDPTFSAYRLHWIDPDPMKNRLSVGISLGTPTIGNLNIVYWGTKTFPISIGVSGMYFSDDQRGFQLDAGWIFDNDGDFRQVVGLAAVAFNETTSTSTNLTDSFGRVVGIQTDTANALKTFLGPTYTAVWNNFRGQVGVTYKVDSSAQNSFRFLLQFGYLIPVISFNH